ncbi:MAG TPA: molybdopterin oxidoreductase [Deltaproteobacteria bacterium]|nr:molybdopterin oxidoreductase [Deltaproteobacteria bacterium]
MAQVIKSVCRGCHGGCGVLLKVEGGRVTEVAGDPECPINRGRICPKGRHYPSIAHHPARLLHPLRKTKGGWKEISWEEAFDRISERLSEAKERFGAETVVFGHGAAREHQVFLYRLANLFGTPNVISPGHICYGPRLATGIAMCGNLPVVDYEGFPRTVVLWGANPLISHPDEYKGFQLIDALKKGVSLVVIDPRRTPLAERADLWLPLRPGTDGALAWGMVNAILREGWYDEDFIKDHVHGWEEFCRRAEDYPLKWAASKTGLAEELIVEAARLYATRRPSAIHWGVPLEQTRNSTNTIRLLLSLMAITGGLDRPGGNVFYPPPPVVSSGRLGLHRELPEEQHRKRLGGDRFRLANLIGLTAPGPVWEAILTGRPYPVKALFLMGTNPMITRANARRVREALEKVDFLVVADFFMTPTAKLADLVLPSATWMEEDFVAELWKRHGYVLARQRATRVGECMTDYEILMELGRRLTDPSRWWTSLEEALDYILSPSGLTWREFCERGYLRGERRFRKYLHKGFSTPTGKVELYSTVFERLGYDPLPSYLDPPELPSGSPEGHRAFPHTLITGARVPFFFHSEGRIPGPLRERHPDPLVEIHPQLAAEKGIKDGDWVRITSPRGTCLQRAKVTDRVPYGVISAEHGWWFPEEKDLGWDKSNVNLLTQDDPDLCDPCMGSTNLRVSCCEVERADG